MAARGTQADRNRTLVLILAALGAILVASILLTTYSVELGIARPSVNTRRIVVAVAEMDLVLERDASFLEYSEALKAALVAHRVLAVRNPADNRVDRALGDALDCYEAIRESYQLELEGGWDPSLHGDPAYWRLFHPAVGLDALDEPVDASRLREALRAEADRHVREAMEIVER